MKNKILHIFCLCFTLVNLSAQIKILDLKKGNCQSFKGQVYVYGISSKMGNDAFYIYKINERLVPTDSLVIELSKNKVENYLQLYSDTLHGFINIYLQKEEKGQLSILRFNKQFELEVKLDKVDVARLNNSSLFDPDVLYINDQVYSLKIISDTSGKQFYINKFELKSAKNNFDYTLQWQFPFERKNIEDAHIFYANKQQLMIFVHVAEGIKKGQWILRLNAANGQLIKAIKVNAKGEKSSYFYGNHYYDPIYRSIHVIGEEYSETQVDISTHILKITDLSSASLYHMEIDSLGELITKQGFKIPINTTSSGAKKVASSFLLKCGGLKKTMEGKLVFDADIYKSTDKCKCFLYANSSTFSLSPAEDGFVLEKNVIRANTLIEDYYMNNDRIDLNGKLCIDSLSQFPKLFYQKENLPVKFAFKLDEESNPRWLLMKHSLNKNNVNFSMLGPVKKIYQISSTEDISETKYPGLILLNKESYILFNQLEEGKFQLKLYSW